MGVPLYSSVTTRLDFCDSTTDGVPDDEFVDPSAQHPHRTGRPALERKPFFPTKTKTKDLFGPRPFAEG